MTTHNLLHSSVTTVAPDAFVISVQYGTHSPFSVDDGNPVLVSVRGESMVNVVSTVWGRR